MDYGDLQVKLLDNVSRFKQAMHDSRGKTDNRLAYDIINETDASTEDVVRIAGQVGNKKYYDSYSFPFSETHIKNKEVKRFKKLAKEVDRPLLTIRDYAWFFDVDDPEILPNVPSVDKIYNYDTSDYVSTDRVKRCFNSAVGKDTSGIDCGAITILTFRQMLKQLNDSNYPSKLVEQLKNDKNEFNKTLGIRHEQISNWGYGNMGLVNPMPTTSVYQIRTVGKVDVEQYIKLASKVYITCKLMEYAVRNDENYKTNGGNARCIGNVLLGKIRWGDSRRTQYMDKLFKLATTMDLLMTMGIAIYSYNGRKTTIARLSRVQTRVRTVYKKFMNAKTVAERQALRELLLSQLKIIAVDFAGHEYDFSIMPCATEQDAEFEANKTSNGKSTNSKLEQVKGQSSGTKIDISKFASATTTAVESYR